MTNLKVYGLSESLVASGYPMRSEAMTTEEFTDRTLELYFDIHYNDCGDIDVYDYEDNKDFKRASKLGSTRMGCAEDNYLNGVIVQFDLTFSNKAWIEAQRYHFLDFVSSMSTMHRISKMNINDCCNEYVDERIKTVVNDLVEQYNADPTPEKYLKLLYNIPSGFEVTARMTTNYRQLKTIWCQRHTHRLPEWRQFCAEIEKLPLFTELTGCGKGKQN